MPSAAQTVAFAQQLVDAALELVAIELEEEGDGKALTRDTIVSIRDALLLACFTGYLGGFVIRIRTLLTLKASSFADTPCHHAGCMVGTECKGNRLELIPPEELPARPEAADDEYTPPVYRYIAPHHKTSRLGKTSVYINVYDSKLTALLSAWEAYGRPQVRSYL